MTTNDVQASIDQFCTLTDLGNAERFMVHFGEVVRYVPELNLFRRFDGKSWNDDDNHTEMKLIASMVVRKIYSEAEMYDAEADRVKIATFAMKSEAADRIKAMISLLPAQPELIARLNEWDADPWLLNVANGTLDLRTGELRNHRAKDYLTTILPTEYHPDAECPLWHKFLDRATGENEELKDYLQRASGYCLTGDTSEQIFFFVYGLGNNGKSVFTGTLRKLLGAYATRVSTDLFMVKDKSSNGHKEGLANLRGKRLVIASELEDGKQLATSLIKDLTGGESIRADRKYHHEIEFQPLCKPWLVGNHEPVIKDTTLSIWRRVKKIPFTVTIPDDEIDRKLADKLEPEYPGILAWMVRGCQDWQKYGLDEPEVVKLTTAIYRAEQDILKDFLDECCVLQKSGVETLADLYKEYKAWCDANDQTPLGKRNFTGRLREKGVIFGKGTGGKHTAYGIRFLTDNEKVEIVEKVDQIPEKNPYARRVEKVSGKLSTKSTKSTNQELPPLPNSPCPNCGGEKWTFKESLNIWVCSNCWDGGKR